MTAPDRETPQTTFDVPVQWTTGTLLERPIVWASITLGIEQARRNEGEAP